jgi:hypothetical protein
MKLKHLFLGFLLAIGVSGCIGFFHLADLRTETAKNSTNDQKARELIALMAEAHNISAWDSISTYRASFDDEFYGLVGKNGNPFPNNKGVFDLEYIPGSFDGRMVFTEGEYKGKTWGIQSWKTYTSENGNMPVFKQNNDIYFWLPTYQYFIEFPLRIQEATAFTYAGTQTIGGIACEGVVASWNNTAPQKGIDQYLIWLDAKTHHIVKMEYTIRELYNFLTGAAHFRDYKNFDGILLPTYLPVESNLVGKGKWLHEMRIEGFVADPVPASDLRPDTQLSGTGSAKE